MVTREQALKLTHRQELHAGKCMVTIGPRGGTTSKHEVWRVNGAAKTWKREPHRFQVPLKYGFNGPFAYLNETNATEFHVVAECNPVIKDNRPKSTATMQECDCMRCEQTFEDAGDHEYCPACRQNMNRGL